MVSFEWDDESKAGLNFRKHGVRMPEAFDDPYAITIADESEPNERRFMTLGMVAVIVQQHHRRLHTVRPEDRRSAAGRLLVVVYAWRGEKIRIISAGPAAPHERNQYGAGL